MIINITQTLKWGGGHAITYPNAQVSEGGQLGFQLGLQLGLSCWAHFFFFSLLDARVQALKGKESPAR